MNRKEYMDADKITEGHYDGSKGADIHRIYFEQFASKGTIQIVLQCIGSERLLASRDSHLNDIPLQLWDNLPMTAHIAAKAKEFGDNTSLSTKVCVYKAAARKWLRENGGLPLWRCRYQYPEINHADAHWIYGYCVGADPVDALENCRKQNSGTVRHEILPPNPELVQ